MKIQIDNVVRDMTEEEETAYLAIQEIAESGDYENSLRDLGVRFDD